MIIKLIRHGRSQQQSGEVNSTLVGDHNVDLTDKEESGVLQARKAGKIIGGEFISQALLYVSPYLRTRRTMYEMIGVDGADAGLHVNSTRDLRIYEDVRLREMEWGFNKTEEELTEEEKYREQFDWFYYRLQGGESPADVYDRVSTFIESLHRQMERKRKTRAVVVSHGITIRCFVMRWLHLSVEQYIQIKNPANCDIITITDKNYLDKPQFVSGKWGVNGIRFREEKALSNKAL